jgi:Type ISP C-terminal specificity domain/N-6 DNA Methylase
MKSSCLTVESAISNFGAVATAKLSNPGAGGNPEDQLRAPFEQLLLDLAALSGHRNVVCVGESSLGPVHLRPDYAVTIGHALTGFVEIKAPGKGADPRKFTVAHDKAQGEKLCSLPNVLFTDGNSFSLWQEGKLVGTVLTLVGDIETSGAKLAPSPGFQALFESFLGWTPTPPTSAKELAHTTARLCRFLRDEAVEQLKLKSPALTALAKDWRRLLFPEADDTRFADGYAQAVTFGLLMARAKGITLDESLQHAADELAHSSTLIGAALHLLTEDPDNRKALSTSLSALTRVLNAVNWSKISKGDQDAWLYFYEEFLGIYDNKLRRLTGSYYTPPEVVEAMVSLVDQALRSSRFSQHTGLASPAVTIADPATGTGTFVLGILRRVAKNVAEDQGEGAVPDSVHETLRRIIAFEMQLGPFAVAQLRILAEVLDLTGSSATQALRMFVTNTLGNPHDEEGHITGLIPRTIAESRRHANRIKREETITVVIGNPPYKDKAKGKGGWVEGQTKEESREAPLNAWRPPASWGIGAHAKHLRNLYIYFWRWATWKVFDPNPFQPGSGQRDGIVCFITVAGFLNGPGFQRMRDYLRRTCDDIWVVDCSPDGHMPEVSTRIFQGVKQPVCIVMASRSGSNNNDLPAAIHFRSLPVGRREKKLEALQSIQLDGKGWIASPSAWRAPFLPQSVGSWSEYPSIQDFFIYAGSGVQPKRTWVIASDARSLLRRWDALVAAPEANKEDLFQATTRDGEPADRHIRSILKKGIPGYPPPSSTLLAETRPSLQPTRYAFRSFDRQWIIPDIRVVTQPNAVLWSSLSDRQMFLTASFDVSPTNGPALTMSSLPPDLNHYHGRGGRVFPLWSDAQATQPNLKPALLEFLNQTLGHVSAEDLFSYIAAVAANPAYTARFQPDLSTPGLRIPITANPALFCEAAEVGRRVLWLHTSGERFADSVAGRPAGPPRVPVNPPSIPLAGRISSKPEDFPDTLNYDVAKRRLLVGHGYIENVSPAVWAYEVSGKNVLIQWFSYRRKNRERPIIGDRRPPSKLNDIQPDHWLPEYTTELLNVLNVLSLLVELEPSQADLLDRICAGPLFSNDALAAANALVTPPKPEKLKKAKSEQPRLF